MWSVLEYENNGCKTNAWEKGKLYLFILRSPHQWNVCGLLLWCCTHRILPGEATWLCKDPCVCCPSRIAEIFNCFALHHFQMHTAELLHIFPLSFRAFVVFVVWFIAYLLRVVSGARLRQHGGRHVCCTNGPPWLVQCYHVTVSKHWLRFSAS